MRRTALWSPSTLHQAYSTVSLQDAAPPVCLPLLTPHHHANTHTHFNHQRVSLFLDCRSAWTVFVKPSEQIRSQACVCLFYCKLTVRASSEWTFTGMWVEFKFKVHKSDFIQRSSFGNIKENINYSKTPHVVQEDMNEASKTKTTT